MRTNKVYNYKDENGVNHLIVPFETFWKTKLEKDNVVKFTKIPNSYRCGHCDCHVYPDQMEKKIKMIEIPDVGRKAIYPCHVCKRWCYKTTR